MVVYMDPLEVPKDHPYDGFGDLIHNWSTYGPPWKGLKNLNRFSLQGYMDPLGCLDLKSEKPSFGMQGTQVMRAASLGFNNIGALLIRIGFWGPLYYNCNKELRQ